MLVTKNGTPFAYVVPARLFEEFARSEALAKVKSAIAARNAETLDILQRFSDGKAPRRAAMKQLGLSWYGDLLDALSCAGLSLPLLPRSRRSAMVREFLKVVRG